MALNGIDRVTFGVPDLAEAKRFLDDWGVAPLPGAPGVLRYETRDGSEVEVRAIDDLVLPPPIEPGGTVREVIWGAETAAELDAALSGLGADRPAQADADGIFRMRDPTGLGIGFRVSRRRPLAVSPTPVNGPGAPSRVDQRSPVYERAHPAKIGHIVLFVDDLAKARAFYERLGFVLSDEYPGHGAFMRCRTPGEHHNLFMLNRPGKPGLNHVAFTVADIHEVIGGGIAMSRKGWKTEIGPGRHPISSAYFWYFHNPLSAPLEYYADEDYCTADWKPGRFERKPELFAEWAIAGGIDGTTRRQIRGRDDSGRGTA
ncbi:MAG TPA: VOC family protein [Hyphomicrobiales bacterium]|nr:VOC family protein [Hyphomicrobiales bacterium]